MTTAAPSSFDRDAVLQEMRDAWDTFAVRRAALSVNQVTGPMDAAGWTAKDHLMHLVCWGNAAYDLIEGIPRYRSFWIPSALYRSGGFDAINAVLQARYRDVPLDRVDLYLNAMHRRAEQTMTVVSPGVAMRPYGWFAPDGMSHLVNEPALRFLLGTQGRHLLAHMDYIESLIAG